LAILSVEERFEFKKGSLLTKHAKEFTAIKPPNPSNYSILIQ